MKTQLSNIMDVTKLEELIRDGYISRKFSPEYPELAILNYSQMAQFDPKLVWDRELNNSRGLIYNTETGEIIARPYPKFWNVNDERHPETMEENLPKERALCTDKLDGSMGTCFPYDGKVHVATRGSFISDQAVWATKWLRANLVGELPEAYTVVTEIIYDANRIVVGYDYEGLIVTGLVNIASGREADRFGDAEPWCTTHGLAIVPWFNKPLSECIKENITGFEGYVLTYPSNGLKIKVKFEEYCRLHKILTGLNPVSIWELLRDNNFETIRTWMADEKMSVNFKDWLRKWYNQLMSDWQHIHSTAITIYAVRPKNADRKTLAMYFTEPENQLYSRICFAMLDKKSVDEIALIIWKMVRPKAADTFRIDGE